MSTIQFKKAKRQNARLVIGMAGVSGSGKTYSALLLAYGLAGYDASKVAIIDTENGRASLYSDALKGAVKATNEPFLIGDLFAPFSPQRYIDSIEAAQQAGIKVLVIDSYTHIWEGIGGCEEIATAGNPKVARWNKAKAEHKRFVNKLLQCDMHVIICIRARDKVKMIRDGGETKFESLGVQPICERNLPFELTASLMMWNSGKQHELLKCPDEIAHLFTGSGYINDTHGAAILDWVQGGAPVDSKLEKWKNSLQSNTEQGLTHIEECWSKVPAAIQKQIGSAFYESLKSSARGHDELREMGAGPQAAEGVDKLNSQITGGDDL
jgi:AAA domain